MEAGLRAGLQALPPAARAELLHALMLRDFERADRIGEFWSYPRRAGRSPELLDRLRGGQRPPGGAGLHVAGDRRYPSTVRLALAA